MSAVLPITQRQVTNENVSAWPNKTGVLEQWALSHVNCNTFCSNGRNNDQNKKIEDCFRQCTANKDIFPLHY